MNAKRGRLSGLNATAHQSATDPSISDGAAIERSEFSRKYLPAILDPKAPIEALRNGYVMTLEALDFAVKFMPSEELHFLRLLMHQRRARN